MANESKFSLRKHFSTLRSQIPDSYRQAAADSAAKLFSTQAIFSSHEHIACYLPFKDEFNSTPVIEAIWRAKKYCYLPVLQQDEKTLMFVRYVYGDSLRLNKFSILEPKQCEHVIEPQQLDVVIAPLLAFDASGHRLGTGGGYYDHTFAFMLKEKKQTPQIIGLGYAEQEAQQIPIDPWDIHLNAMLTEKTLLTF